MTARDGNIRGFEAAEALGQIRYEPQHLVLYRELSRLGGRRLETPKAHSYQCLRIHDAVLPYDLNRLLPRTNVVSVTHVGSVCLPGRLPDMSSPGPTHYKRRGTSPDGSFLSG